MKIKVCGLKHPENISEVAALGADYLGFIFYGPSPRFVGSLDAEHLRALPASIVKTGVFVNEAADKISEEIARYNFDAIQLHGNESPAFCSLFKGSVQVLKAFGMDEEFNFGLLDGYRDSVDYFLFDAKTSIHGGSGKTFNWEILSKYQLDIPFFLSGGLSLDNLDEVRNISHPQFYGADLNSRFEMAPGLKDINKLKKAFAIIKSAKEHEVRS